MKQLLVLFLILLGTTLNSQEKLYVIPIHGDIEPSLTIFIRNSIKKANEADAHILFDINTFGGRVDSALQIATLIGSVRDRDTIAYIPADPEGLGVSWSAGALISFACNKIYMAEGTSIGAASPVYMTPEGSQSAEEKTVSAVRVQMASLAEKNGYPPLVALAMVDKDVELYEEQIYGLPILKLKEDLIDVESSKLVCPTGKLLTLTARQMEYYGLSTSTVKELSEVLLDLDISREDVKWLTPNLPDQIISFLTSTAVLALLMSLGLVTLYLELTSPGFGVLGTIGIISFAIVFLGGELLGTLGSIELLLFLLGVALLVVELFVIPGFGLTGTLGIISISLALILSQQDFFIPKWQWQWDLFNRNILVVLSSILGSFITLTILMSLFPRISLFNRLILQSPHGNKLPVFKDSKETLERQKGTTLTELRPVGKIKVCGEILIGESDGKFIEKDRSIYVISHIGNRVVVREDKNEVTL